jgi:adenylate cyclase
MFNKFNNLHQIALEKYLGKHLTALINTKKEKQLGLFGEVFELSVMFNCISNYSSLSKKLNPESIIPLIYAYHEAALNSIESNNGVVINIFGDQVLSFFGYNDQEHHLKSIKAHFDATNNINNYLRSHNAELNLQIDSGISTGKTLLGNFGSHDRLFYSLFGDNVDFANRLCKSNSIYGTSIIISNKTYSMAQKYITARELDNILVMGMEKSQAIHEIISIDSNAIGT